MQRYENITHVTHIDAVPADTFRKNVTFSYASGLNLFLTRFRYARFTVHRWKSIRMDVTMQITATFSCLLFQIPSRRNEFAKYFSFQKSFYRRLTSCSCAVQQFWGYLLLLESYGSLNISRVMHKILQSPPLLAEQKAKHACRP